MKSTFKTLVCVALLFSTSAFSFNTQSYICYSPSGGILFGGTARISEIPTVRLMCESVGGNLVLGSLGGPIN